jgi:hypothetical protein
VTGQRGRDLRQYARSTQTRLILGALFLLFTVGGGLIAWVYGREAAALAVVCIAVGLTPVILIALWLAIVDWAARKGQDE